MIKDDTSSFNEAASNIENKENISEAFQQCQKDNYQQSIISQKNTINKENQNYKSISLLKQRMNQTDYKSGFKNIENRQNASYSLNKKNSKLEIVDGNFAKKKNYIKRDSEVKKGNLIQFLKTSHKGNLMRQLQEVCPDKRSVQTGARSNSNADSQKGDQSQINKPQCLKISQTKKLSPIKLPIDKPVKCSKAKTGLPDTTLKVNQSKFQKIHPGQQNLANQSSLTIHKKNGKFINVFDPLRQDCKVNFTFDRHSSCFSSESIKFDIPDTSNQSLEALKVRNFWGSEFKIIDNPLNYAITQLGTLQSNFTGSIYNFYRTQRQVILCSILFNQSIESNFRMTQIYINTKKTMDNKKMPKKYQSLKDIFKLFGQQESGIQCFVSKLPQKNQKTGKYYLNFQTDQILPSVKNTIFVDKQGTQVMKYFKNSKSTYNVTFQKPFSWLIAYCYALATTDFKLCTQ